jgi:hypothetical protein
MENWKARYDRLAKYSKELTQRISELTVLQYRINAEIEDADRADLRERNKVRYMRLTEDVTLKVQYYEKGQGREQTFKAGTLINCDLSGAVYLDEDGDGHWYFPPEKLEPVELDFNDPNVDWDNVVHQG